MHSFLAKLSVVLAASFCCTTSYPVPPHEGDFIDARKRMKCENPAECEQLSIKYYKYIQVLGPDGQPSPSLKRGTLSGWKELHGFNSNAVGPASNDVRASYFNRGDLAIGRDMHCRAYRAPSQGIEPFQRKTLACYVTNFADNDPRHDFGDSDPGAAIANAVTAASAGHNPIATVVMETTYISNAAIQSVQSAEPEVWFAAYNTAGNPLTKARLDISTGKQPGNEQAIPGICLACHGGSGKTTQRVEEVNGQVVVHNARFLPFDPAQFLYGNGTRRTPNAQEQEQFRKLNAMIKDVYKGFNRHPLKELIDGWYRNCGGVNQLGCTIDEFVPSAACTKDDGSLNYYETCGWTTGKPLFAQKKPGFDIERFYRSVPATYCRTCHIALFETFNIQSFNTWTNGSLRIDSQVRDRKTMPFAEATFKNYWNDPSAITLLNQFLDDVFVLTPKQQCISDCSTTAANGCASVPVSGRKGCVEAIKRVCAADCR